MSANAGTMGRSGVGMAKDKGPGNNRTRYVSLLTPHVVAAGSATLDGSGDATVTFPKALAGGKAAYVIIATTNGGTAQAVAATGTDVNGAFASFAIKGTAAAVVFWAVISKGNA